MGYRGGNFESAGEIGGGTSFSVNLPVVEKNALHGISAFTTTAVSMKVFSMPLT
jgi:hypothetical protein